MKKLFFLCAALLTGLSSWAQTDVTSTYLDNAGFDTESDFVTTGVCTYAKDVSSNKADGSSLMAVTGWTAGDTGDAKAGACLKFGSNAWLTGTSYVVPATNSDGNAEGGCLALGGCWGGNAYYTQALKQNLAAGTYTIEICGYNGNTNTAFGTQTFGVKEAGGTTHYVSTTWTSKTWVKASLVFELSAETAATFYVGATGVAGGSGSSAKLFIDYVKIYSGIDLTAWNEAKAAAQTALDTYDESYAATERAAVVSAMSVADPATAAALTSALNTLNDAVAAYTPKAANEKLIAEKKTLTDFINGISTNYPNSSTAIFPADLSSWTGSTYVANNGSEHWSGVKTYYYEQTGSQWGQDSWSIAAEKTVNLPAGKYAFVVTARASSGVTSTMTVDGTEVTLSNRGSAGYGVTTDGTASYDMANTYANTAGRGWEYAYAEFEVTEAKDVTISFAASASAKYNWVSIANPVLYYNDAAKESMAIVDAKANLATAIAAVKVPTANVGTGVFQYNADEVTALNTALTTAQGVYDNAAATLAEVNAQIAAVQALTSPSVNQPTAAIKGALKLVYTGWTYDQKYASAYVNASAQGGYSMGYFDRGEKDYYVWTVTPTSDGYVTLSFTDADAATRYMSTGTVYGGNAYQIRTTTDETSALKITVVPSTTVEGIISLLNTEANVYIGSQDQGVFTVNSHNDFNFETTWTKTGRIRPASTWSGYVYSADGATVVVEGTYGSNTIKVIDTGYYGNYFTLTCDENDAITAFNFNGTDVDVTSSGGGYFDLGDIYYAYFYPTYSSYANADPDNGYVTLSAWYYDSSNNSIWGYVDIEWYDGVDDFETASFNIKGTAQYGTFVAPFTTAIPAAYNSTNYDYESTITAYTVDAADETGLLTLTKLTSASGYALYVIPANTPVVVYTSGTDDLSYTVQGPKESSANLTTGLLTGVLEATTAPAGTYVLQNQTEGGVGFYQTDGTKTVPANRCYLTAPVGGVKAFFFGNEGQADAIRAIEALTSGNAKIYDLNGRQLQKLQKGINIVNGHKVMVK